MATTEEELKVRRRVLLFHSPPEVSTTTTPIEERERSLANGAGRVIPHLPSFVNRDAIVPSTNTLLLQLDHNPTGPATGLLLSGCEI